MGGRRGFRREGYAIITTATAKIQKNGRDVKTRHEKNPTPQGREKLPVIAESPLCKGFSQGSGKVGKGRKKIAHPTGHCRRQPDAYRTASATLPSEGRQETGKRRHKTTVNGRKGRKSLCIRECFCNFASVKNADQGESSGAVLSD